MIKAPIIPALNIPLAVVNLWVLEPADKYIIPVPIIVIPAKIPPAIIRNPPMLCPIRSSSSIVTVLPVGMCEVANAVLEKNDKNEIKNI